MIRIGMFGAGRMAADHARSIAGSRLAQLTWILDPHVDSGQNLASLHKCTHHTSFQNAIAQTVDAFIIASPSPTHVEYIQSLVPLAKPIFCEKPIASNTKQVLACADLIKTKAVPFLLGFNRRFDPSISSLHQRVRSGEIGSVQSVSIVSRDHPLPPLAYLKTSGGIFYDMTIHDFDVARWMLGEEVTEVFATGSALILPELKQYDDVDSAVTILRTASGKMAQISNSRYSAFGYDQRIEVFGSKGLLRCNNLQATTLERFGAEGILSENPYPNFSQRYKEAYQLEMEHFLRDVVSEKKTPLVGAHDGLQANLIADAATKSLKSGKMELVESIFPHNKENIL